MTATGTATIITMTDTALLKLMTWLSPAFPTGGFSYSHGLEQAIVDGAVKDAETLTEWLADLLAHGSGWNDSVLLGEAWRAVAADDHDQLAAAAELAAALSPSRERSLETLNQGGAFVKSVAAWPTKSVTWLAAFENGRVALPIAVGATAAGHGIALAATLMAFLQAFAGNLVSVAVRLVPLGQSDGLQVLAGLHDQIEAVAARAAAATTDDLGSATILSDVAAMRHETLYSRVFRS